MSKKERQGRTQETRALPIHEIRAEQTESGEMVIEGYAIVYNSETVLYESEDEKDVEIILEGASREALKTSDQFYLWQHDRTQPLARVANGTLEATEDARGVKIRATLPDTQWGRDRFADIKSGLVDAQSFAFYLSKEGEAWEIFTDEKDGKKTYRRTITQFAGITEFSAVTWPAYEATTLQARDLEAALRNRPSDSAESQPDATAVAEVMRDARENLEQIRNTNKEALDAKET